MHIRASHESPRVWQECMAAMSSDLCIRLMIKMVCFIRAHDRYLTRTGKMKNHKTLASSIAINMAACSIVLHTSVLLLKAWKPLEHALTSALWILAIFNE